MGNHHFPALARTALAEELHKVACTRCKYTIFGSGGGEAIDIALKSARHATEQRKIVSIIKAYHGHTGLAVAPATSASPSCSCPTGRTSSSRSRSTISTRWRRRCAAATSPP